MMGLQEDPFHVRICEWYGTGFLILGKLNVPSWQPPAKASWFYVEMHSIPPLNDQGYKIFKEIVFNPI
jgi:hypothetical protein